MAKKEIKTNPEHARFNEIMDNEFIICYHAEEKVMFHANSNSFHFDEQNEQWK